MKLAEWIDIEKDLKIRFIFDNAKSYLFLEIENTGENKPERTFILNLSGNEMQTGDVIKLDQIKHGSTIVCCSQLAIVETDVSHHPHTPLSSSL